MKKFFVVIIFILAVALSVFIGFNAGVNHVIQDSKISVDGKYVLIEIDNNIYAHYVK